MIQLRSGTETARLTGASFCICEQQPETLGVSPAIVNQMERSPFIHFKLETLHKSAPSLAKASHCKRDAICSWRGGFWLQDEHSSSSNRAVPTYTCCFWKAGIDPSAELHSVQTEGTKPKSWCSLIKGNNCWALPTAKLISSSNGTAPHFHSASPYLCPSLFTHKHRCLTLAKLQFYMQSQHLFSFTLVSSSSSSLAFASKCSQRPDSSLQPHFSLWTQILPQTFIIIILFLPKLF